jgi:hypothetical protein
MLTRLQVTDFKAFQALDIEIRPLTILLGPNNTGKSSIIAPVRLLAQTLTSADPGITLRLDGPFGDFGTFRDIVFGNESSTSFQIRLSGESSPPPYHARHRPDSTVSWNLRAEFGYRSRRRQLILKEVEISDSTGHLLTASYVASSDRHVIVRISDTEVPSALRGRTAKLLDLMNFVPYVMFFREREGTAILGRLLDSSQMDDIIERIDGVIWGIRQTLGHTEYIGGMRVPPERTYHQTGEGRAAIGASGENWTGILVADSSRAGGGSQKLQSRLGAWLKEAGLASEVRFNWLSDRHYEVQIRHPITREYENIADVGQGNSQVIPVLLGGLRLSQNSLYMVEEPEIHLHPKAQAELGDFFNSLRSSGVHSIVETHSEYLLLRIQQRVAAGDLDPNDVAFYYTYATPRGAKKRVKKLTLDGDARFEQTLSGGFFPERLNEARKLAQLRG